MSSMKVRGVLKSALVVCVLAAFWNACGTTDAGKAQLVVSPGAVTFKDTAGMANPSPLTIAVSASGTGTVSGLNAAVSFGSGPSGWLTVALSDTVTPATLTVTPMMTGLAPATYQATITVAGNGASNSPATIPVGFEVAAAPLPGIALSVPSATFADTEGSSNPPSQTVSLTANGQGKLTGLKAAVTYNTGLNGWLTATLSDTTAPATLTLKANVAGLHASTNQATVSISANGASNSPQSLPVTFNVATAPPVNGVTIVATANLGCSGDLAKATADVINQANPDYVFVLGRNAPPATNGTVATLQDYNNCFNPVFGRFKDKTYATLGDHEVDIDSIPPNFGTGMAAGADTYFTAAKVGPPGQNWQSVDLGSWHVIFLNVQTPGGYKRPPQIAYHAGSDQLNWLINDLKTHSNKCTLAVWYESMWISSTSISNPNDPLHKNDYRIQDVRGVWTELYNYNADLVLNGWPFIYERFAPMRYDHSYQDPTLTEWAADSVRGIRQITTGLGGDGPTTADSAVVRLPTSEYRSGGNGVLKVVLGDGVYSWEFLNTRYSNIHDKGHGVCH
jgi:hypothetical protein